MEIPSYKLQFLGYISNGDMRSLPQRDSQSILYLADVCEQACNVFPCCLRSWGPRSWESLVLSPVLWILPLLQSLGLSFLATSFSLSPISSNSLLVSSSHNINVLKNLLSWKRIYLHFYLLSFPFLIWRGYLNKYPLVHSSLLYLPSATETKDNRLGCH